MIKKILSILLKRKLLTAGIVVVLIFIFWISGSLGGKKTNGFVLEKASMGTVVKEISETGTVRASDEINLSFATTGKIGRIYVNAGDEVKAGQALAELDPADLQMQLRQAQADLQLALAKKSDAGISLQTAEQSLKDARAKAGDSLNSAYNDARVAIDDASVKLYTAYSAVYEVKLGYFTSYQGDAGTFIDNYDAVKLAYDRVSKYKAELTNDNIGDSLSKTKNEVLKAKAAIDSSVAIVRSAGFKDIVSSTDKASLETQRTNLNTSYSTIIAAEESIASAKITNQTNLNTAESQITSLENQLSGGTALYEAQVAQANAKISLLQTQLNDIVLKSPIDGRISQSERKIGEIVSVKDSIVSVISKSSFEVKVDIYEGDIANVNIGNPVKIALVAFPDEEFAGKVIDINPGEKLVDNVVNYETTIEFENIKEGIRNGMTADIIVESGKKENVLMVPRRAIEKVGRERFAKVLKGGKESNIKVETGFEGNDYIEIVSGLKSGDEVITGKKI